jgi:hypothetical protein
MTWVAHHEESERLAAEAELARRRGDEQRAVELYHQAAEAEVRALFDLDPNKARTLGITVVSAVALWYRAKQYYLARKLAHHWLATDQLPPFAQDELQTLLQMIWSTTAQEAAGVEFVEGDVLVSVRGGKVVFGGAPLNLVVRKVEEVQALFYRTIEMLLGVPHRKRGAPSAEVQSIFQPWLFQAPAGSYQFAVRVQKPEQIDFFPEASPKVARVVETCLSIVRASVEDPEGVLKELVPDPEYQVTFLKLARNLAPTGESFGQIEFRDPTQLVPEPVALVPEARKYLNQAIRARTPRPSRDQVGQAEELKGVLRGVHLDEDWLDVALLQPNGQHLKVVEIGDVLDDVIGPMVNHRVLVDVVIDQRGRYIFRDIQPLE